jgi:hypothetical protein
MRVLLAACQPLSSSATGTFDFQQADDNHAARWEVMARFYEEMSLLDGLVEPLAGSVRTAERPSIGDAPTNLNWWGLFLLREQRVEDDLRDSFLAQPEVVRVLTGSYKKSVINWFCLIYILRRGHPPSPQNLNDHCE